MMAAGIVLFIVSMALDGNLPEDWKYKDSISNSAGFMALFLMLLSALIWIWKHLP